MKQKDIYLANLDMTVGSEQRGTRPVIIISGDTINKYMHACIVCTVTTQIKKRPGSLFLRKSPDNGLMKDSEILPFQLRTIAEERLIKKLGVINDETLQKIKHNLFDLLNW